MGHPPHTYAEGPQDEKCRPALDPLVVYKHLNGNKKVCYLQFQNNIIIFSIKKFYHSETKGLRNQKIIKLIEYHNFHMHTRLILGYLGSWDNILQLLSNF